jgi:ABC-2 type transport system permease protein
MNGTAMTTGYLRLELRRLLRDRGYLIGSVIMPLVMYLLFTNLGSLTGQQKGVAATYAMISMAAFGAIGAVLNNGGQIVEERASGWLRQLRTTPMPPLRVVAVRAVSGMVVALPAIAAVCLAGVLVNGVSLDASQWVGILVMLWLGVIPFALLGLAIGHVATARTLPVMNMLSYLGLAILGGLWFPLDVFPAPVRFIGQLMPTHGYGDLSWRIAFGQSMSVGDLAVLAGWLVIFGALAAFAYRRAGRTT